MPNFKNLSELNAHISIALQDVIQNEVANAVRKEWIASMEKNVYDPYKPKKYSRRSTDGGLSDPNNIQIVKESHAKDHALFILENLTRGNGWDDYAGKLINSMIEGSDGFAGNPVIGMPARPYTEDAVDFMTRGIGRNTILEALNSGLAKRGLNINIK
ncbi:hypothetical protein [Staphylococcus gallinarum]|uniref:hypothetical protein n=1 Tax=Staphylococcus gallinarum TaxID=1293 RepID=UPI0030C19451